VFPAASVSYGEPSEARLFQFALSLESVKFPADMFVKGLGDDVLTTSELCPVPPMKQAPLPEFRQELWFAVMAAP
jgi:hypothetical protein